MLKKILFQTNIGINSENKITRRKTLRSEGYLASPFSKNKLNFQFTKDQLKLINQIYQPIKRKVRRGAQMIILKSGTESET
jgi:hypothetical protein